VIHYTSSILGTVQSLKHTWYRRCMGIGPVPILKWSFITDMLNFIF